jgi:hypothetical protein
MSGATSPGDNNFQATLDCGRSVVEQQIRRTVCRHDLYFVLNVQCLQYVNGVSHCVPIGLGTHDDSNLCIHISSQLAAIPLRGR